VNPRPLVAVLTDFGADSFYVGVMKSVIHAVAPQAEVIDVTHTIGAHAVAEASYVLKTVFDFFRPGTVFLAVVDPGVGGARRNLVTNIGGRFVVGPDNGVLTDLVEVTAPESTHVIDENLLARFRTNRVVGRTFLGRDVFAPAAGAIASGQAPSDIGRESTATPARVDVPVVSVNDNFVSARARYVDTFGNVLTGITTAHLKRAFGSRHHDRVRAVVEGVDVGPLCEYYGSRPAGTLMALVDSWDVVEVSVSEGRAIDRFPGRAAGEISVELHPDDR
jgi:S-adenosylmethionine hydrolase